MAFGHDGRSPALAVPLLLTISTTMSPATDLGYLLHKHPGNVRSVAFPFGDAHVFFPEATDDRCTAAVLVEVDPVGSYVAGVGRVRSRSRWPAT
jgi:hypothetical protein